MTREKPKVTIILNSCLTGNAVWIYRGPSKAAAAKAYQRAVRKEIEYVKSYGRRMARRMEKISGFLQACLANVRELTPQQREAVRRVRELQKADAVCHSEFYDHIMEVRRRRAADAEIRRQMRERESKPNPDYVK